jgi:hypothetical protein
MKSVEIPTIHTQIVNKDGGLSQHGLILLQKMAEALVEAQAKIEALENA